MKLNLAYPISGVLCLSILSLISAKNVTVTQQQGDRPVIHTFFQRVDPSVRTTDMSDEDDDSLLEYWKEAWSQAGWEPVVLTLKDAQKHKDYKRIKSKLDDLYLGIFGNLLFTRWIAMAAVGGGWYADYDVFPLVGLPPEMPSNGTMTVYDIASPTLASGNAKEWSRTLNALLEDAKQSINKQGGKLKFWTDSLGILNLMNKYAKQSPCPQSKKQVALPYGAKDPVLTSYGCGSKSFRNRWVVHFGPQNLQGALLVPPELRQPKHRATLAKEWLSEWMIQCGSTVETSAEVAIK